ncbi:hypothetical protein JY96_11345 [Aquabacterium sp. NJ1]|uniref:DUF4268 domain-containing protein n=1 Tax=Aquabacterium sp. NJ1 TaxID=1538295 RepID=UPI00052CC8B7|nr:DUF4268 domain-containing protein [Aquabacterium sp. NJ1]KGM40433.1 hypothetical protein JY96_11345 [Aquabacterium sp. NJ1]
MNATRPIGKLERVPLRQVWEHEAYDFTQWLQDHIEVLNEALGLNLVNVDREQAAGSFSIDLVAEDEGGGKVIIENQLEKSNHDHLGKVITYLVSMGAKAAIWIVSEPRPEHVAAITWLNENNSAQFYMLKVEAVRIGESLPAPLFTLIVGPSEESTSVGKAKKEFAERYEIRHRWWTQLIERSTQFTKLHAHITPGEYTWIGTSAGVRGLNLNYVVTQDDCAVELYIDRGKDAQAENESIFDQLEAHTAQIEQAFGSELSWQRLDGKRACRIRFTQAGGYRSPEEEWPSLHDRAAQAMDRLDKALKPFIKHLKLGNN